MATKNITISSIYLNNPHKAIINWLLTGCILIYLMVVIGGITRLTHSGLSMVEWNMIMGSLPPLSDADWTIPFEKYQQSPEFKKINSHFTLEDFKSIYWWEYSHRFLGRLIGFIFLIPFIYFLIKKRLSASLTRKCLVILALGAFQGVLGWYMVKSGLVKNPNVSHYRLAAHLISAFTVFAYTFWVALDLLFSGYIQTKEKLNTIKVLSLGLLMIVIIQIIYGAFVAGLKAGYYYPTFPKMGENWIAEGVFMVEPFWKSILEGIAGVQFIHRYVAYLVVIMVLIIWNYSLKFPLSFLQKKSLHLLLLVTFFQFTLGVFTLIYSVPIVIATLHQTGAFLLLASLLFFIHQLKAETN